MCCRRRRGKSEIGPDSGQRFIRIAEEAFCFLRFFLQDEIRYIFPGILLELLRQVWSAHIQRSGDTHIYAASSRIVAGDAAAGHSEGAAANMHTAAAAAAIAACVVAADLSAVHIEFAAVPHIHSSAVPDGGVIGDAAAVHGKGAVILHPYAAASPSGVFTAGSGVAGDAAAVHDEIAILAQIHTVSKE